MNNKNTIAIGSNGEKGILFSVLIAIVLLAPKFLFFGTLGYAVFSIGIDRYAKKPIRIPWFYLAFILYYLLYAIALVWTNDIGLGMKDLEYKMLFVAGPLLFTFTKWNQKDLFAFMVGLNLVITTLFIYVIYLFLGPHSRYWGWFSHDSNALKVHPTYMAMYAGLGASIALYHLLFTREYETPKKKNLWNSLWTLFLITSSVYVYMVDSKAGILGLLIGLAIVAVAKLYRVFSKRTFIISMSILFVAFTVAVGFVLTRPQFKGGIDGVRAYLDDKEAFIEKNREKISSNEVRVLVWDATFELVNENPFGVGPGDVRQELLIKYDQKNFTAIKEKKLNPHSQYLQTLLGLGYPGLLLLLFLFVRSTVFAIKRKNPLYLLLSVLIIFNALFESILELQVGVFYFVFMTLIFDQTSRHNYAQLNSD